MNTPTQYHTRVTRMTVLPKGEPIFSESATHIEIDDEAAGEFVKVTQQRDQPNDHSSTLTFDPDEWPEVRAAVDSMMVLIRLDQTPAPKPNATTAKRERNEDGELKD